jgi:hypothetical protein
MKARRHRLGTKLRALVASELLIQKSVHGKNQPGNAPIADLPFCHPVLLRGMRGTIVKVAVRSAQRVRVLEPSTEILSGNKSRVIWDF